MILQAFRAELFKLVRNRWTAYWAFLFMPTLTLLIGLADESFGHFYTGNVIPFADPVSYGIMGLGTMQNSISQLFAIVGASILFAGEYRWETWRAILPRTERHAAIFAKLMVFALAIATSIVLCGVARMFVGLYDAALTPNAVPLPYEAGNVLLATLVIFAANFLQLMATAGLVLIIGVITRSMMAAIVAPVLILFACEIATLRIGFANPDMWTVILPNIAGRSIQQSGFATLGDADAFGTHLALPGAAALVLWLVLLTGAAIYLFQRQDLSRE